jgi:hypothetical protein
MTDLESSKHSLTECVKRSIPSHIEYEQSSAFALGRMVLKNETMKNVVQLCVAKHKARAEFLEKVFRSSNEVDLLNARQIMMDPYLDPHKISSHSYN